MVVRSGTGRQPCRCRYIYSFQEGATVSEVAAAATDVDRDCIYVLTEDGRFWAYDLDSREWEPRQPVPDSNAAEGGYDLEWG